MSKKFDEDYMGVDMMLNPRAYGIDDGYRGRRNDGFDPDSILIFALIIIASPFIFIYKRFAGEEMESGDIAMALAGVFLLIVVIMVIYITRKCKKYSNNSQQSNNTVNTKTKINYQHKVNNEFKIHEPYKAKANNSFVE